MPGPGPMPPGPEDAILTVTFDANIIYPMALCDYLLWAAQRSVFRPGWSRSILDEAERNLVAKGVPNAPRRMQAAGQLLRGQAVLDAIADEHSGTYAARGFSDLRAGFVLRDESSRGRRSRASHGSGAPLLSTMRPRPTPGTRPPPLAAARDPP